MLDALREEIPAPFALTFETLMMLGRYRFPMVPLEMLDALREEIPAPFALTFETLMMLGRYRFPMVPLEMLDAFKEFRAEPFVGKSPGTIARNDGAPAPDIGPMNANP